ncbi:DUF551 domain-containing protein [Ochrobactrum soli]|uniref:DUF551 domain-containing protein n=1 Tax=Ochrobactrum soli TaxID=2448455 RepID=A0A2P9HJZ3_9HYPH|nr:DUF551 domain-containing protein [[Ochrobactrum] soli]SPL64446.1 hypothetical protein OHAE_313 [[Ochrobactrum] soli]
MTTLPEEAVKAAHEAARVRDIRDERSMRERVVDALTAAAPHLAAARVKKLEWVATGQTGFLETEFYAVAGPLMHTVHPLKDVDGPFNEHYSIHRDWNDREVWRVTYYVGNNGLSGISKACKSLEAAKAAAQADYEARILSALEATSGRSDVLEDKDRLDAATAALISLTEAGIPTDVQELLIVGDPSRGVAPGSLSKAIATVIRALHPVADKPSDDGAQGEGWLPIESAPKDGTAVLAYQAGRYFKCWLECDQYEGGYFWQDEEDSEPSPTHWRPLPSAPASEGAE